MNKKIPTPLAILIILLVIAVIIGVALWICPEKEAVLLQDEIVSLETYIIFQDKKVTLGDTFNFSPQNECVEDTVATLSAIEKDSVTFKIKEWNWKDNLKTSIEEITEYKVRDKDCIVARPKCMDVGYKYCFSLSVINSVLNVNYELKGESLIPLP